MSCSAPVFVHICKYVSGVISVCVLKLCSLRRWLGGEVLSCKCVTLSKDPTDSWTMIVITDVGAVPVTSAPTVRWEVGTRESPAHWLASLECSPRLKKEGEVGL